MSPAAVQSAGAETRSASQQSVTPPTKVLLNPSTHIKVALQILRSYADESKQPALPSDFIHAIGSALTNPEAPVSLEQVKAIARAWNELRRITASNPYVRWIEDQNKEQVTKAGGGDVTGSGRSVIPGETTSQSRDSRTAPSSDARVPLTSTVLARDSDVQFHELLRGTSIAPMPPPQSLYTPEFKQELAQKRAKQDYEELHMMIHGKRKTSVSDSFTFQGTMKDISIGVNIILIMITGFVVFYYVGGMLFPHNLTMKMAIAAFGLVAALLLEVTMLLIRDKQESMINEREAKKKAQLLSFSRTKAVISNEKKHLQSIPIVGASDTDSPASNAGATTTSTDQPRAAVSAPRQRVERAPLLAAKDQLDTVADVVRSSSGFPSSSPIEVDEDEEVDGRSNDQIEDSSVFRRRGYGLTP